MGYDRGGSFPLDFEPNGFPFGSKSKKKLSLQPYTTFQKYRNIVFSENTEKYSFLSVPQLGGSTRTAVRMNVPEIPVQ